MADTAVQTPKRERVPLNGVDVPNLFATVNVVKENPPLAKFQFRTKHQWLNGTHSRGTIEILDGVFPGAHFRVRLPLAPALELDPVQA